MNLVQVFSFPVEFACGSVAWKGCAQWTQQHQFLKNFNGVFKKHEKAKEILFNVRRTPP